MKFLNNGDVSFADLEMMMFEGGIKRLNAGQKQHKISKKKRLQ